MRPVGTPPASLPGSGSRVVPASVPGTLSPGRQVGGLAYAANPPQVIVGKSRLTPEESEIDGTCEVVRK